MFLKGLYSVLLGIFLTIFVSVGIATFYPQPQYGPIPACSAPSAPEKGIAYFDQTACTKAIATQQKQQDMYTEIVSSLALVDAVIFFVISMLIFEKQIVFSYAFLFGSIFTLLYSNARGLSTNEQLFKFILVTISVILVMAIGFVRFVKTPAKKKKK